MHDRNGKPVSKGDKVMVPCTITDTSATLEHCNITLITDEKMFPGEHPTTIVLNAKQVEKVESP